MFKGSLVVTARLTIQALMHPTLTDHRALSGPCIRGHDTRGQAVNTQGVSGDDDAGIEGREISPLSAVQILFSADNLRLHHASRHHLRRRVLHAGVLH